MVRDLIWQILSFIISAPLATSLHFMLQTRTCLSFRRSYQDGIIVFAGRFHVLEVDHLTLEQSWDRQVQLSFDLDRTTTKNLVMQCSRR